MRLLQNLHSVSEMHEQKKVPSIEFHCFFRFGSSGSLRTRHAGGCGRKSGRGVEEEEGAVSKAR